MGNFSLEGHLTGVQYAQRMSNANGNSVSPPIIDEIELGDIEIEDVAPKKERVPFLTKRGKIVVALLIVGGALYYIWQRNQARKAGATVAEAPQASQADAQKSEMTAETASQTTQSVSQEDGTEGVDL
jgi:cytoskeletal protein RodZ